MYPNTSAHAPPCVGGELSKPRKKIAGKMERAAAELATKWSSVVKKIALSPSPTSLFPATLSLPGLSCRRRQLTAAQAHLSQST